MRHSKTFTIAILLGIMMAPYMLYAYHSIEHYDTDPLQSMCDSILTFKADGTCTKRIIQEHDNRGIITRKAKYSWDNGQWVQESLDERIVNAFGKMELSLEMEMMGNWGEKYENTYDANGYQLSEAHYDYIGRDQWILGHRVEYVNDSIGRMIKRTSYYKEKEGLTLSYVDEFSYNDAEHTQTQLRYSNKEGKLVLSSKEETTRDVQDRNISMTNYAWKEEQWNPFDKRVITDNGMEYTWTIFKWKDGEWAPQSRHINIYNERGEEIGSKRCKWTGSRWKVSYQRNTKIKTSRTAKGIKETRKTKDKEGLKVTLSFVEVKTYRAAKTNPDSLICISERKSEEEYTFYSYDDNDHLISTKTLYGDSPDDPDEETIEYYNEYGQPTLEECYQYNDGKPVLDRYIRYYYSAHKETAPR